MRRQVRGALIVAALGASCATTSGLPVATSDGGAVLVSYDAFDVFLTTGAVLRAEVPSTAQVKVTTRRGYHLNDDYPIHFVPTPAEGLEFARTRIDRSSGVTTVACQGDASAAAHACEAHVAVPYVARGTRVTLGGVLAVSACDEEHCVIEKVPIATTVPVVAR